MRVIVITNWICCFILTVLLQNSHAFNSEQFKITHSKKCSSTETMFRILYEKSLSECVFECDIRPKCAAINYRKRRLQCELLEGGNTIPFVPNSDQTGPCVYIHKRNISLNASEHCGNNCMSGEVCDTDSGQCIILECHPLSLANGKILGNMYNVGARLKTKCNAGFVEVDNNVYTTCNTSGRWHPTIRCMEECDGDLRTTITCESPSNADTVGVVCDATDASLLIHPIILLEEFTTPSKCVEDNGYQLEPSTGSIRVKKGCNGLFQVCGCWNSAEVQCDSSGHQKAKCIVLGAGEIIYMEVKRKDSTSACKQNIGYGFAENYIWVDVGCRANFHVCFKP